MSIERDIEVQGSSPPQLRVLSDCPRAAAALLPPGMAWRPIDDAVLDPAEQALWRALSRDRCLHVADLPAPVRLWRRLVVIADAERSQLDALHDALAGGAPVAGPTACLALDGSGFRGQRRRAWATVPGNLFLVVALFPDAPAAALLPGLIALPAVALVDAITRLGGTARIKWVNDVLLDGRKVAGVLTTSQCRGPTMEAALLGLGVNVACAPDLTPTPFVPRVGSLQAAGVEASLREALWAVLDALAGRWRELLVAGPGPLVGAYRDAACVVGEQVRIWHESDETVGPVASWPPPFAAGVVQAIDDDLSLRLRGRDAPLHEGRLAFESACVATKAR